MINFKNTKSSFRKPNLPITNCVLSYITSLLFHMSTTSGTVFEGFVKLQTSLLTVVHNFLLIYPNNLNNKQGKYLNELPFFFNNYFSDKLQYKYNDAIQIDST